MGFLPVQVLVFFTIILQLAAAICLTEAAEYYREEQRIFFALLFILIAFSIHLLRFWLWGSIYKITELSRSYPYISLYFPLIYITALLRGDSDFEGHKLLGSIMITVGVLLLSQKK